MLNNRLLLITIFLTIIIAPLAAFLTITATSTQDDQHLLTAKTVTSAAVKNALDKENGYLASDEQPKSITVNSIKRYDSVWYVAHVTYTDQVTNNSQQSVALVGDLKGSPNNLTVILKPEDVFPSVNISAGMGVPYDVIDTINTFYNNRDGKGE
jgi:hypothetical protein